MAKQVEEAAAAPANAANEYPKAKYARAKVSPSTPHGYKVRRVNSPEEEESLGKDWKDSPADLR